MKSNALLFWLAILLFVGGGLAIWTALKMADPARADSASPSPATRAEIPAPAYDPHETLTRFTLTERTGKQVTSESLDGEIWVASFFFSSCPQRCMQQNLKIKELYEQYAPLGVKFVSITCDPATDRPSVLTTYAERLGVYSQDWLFLTGNMAYITKVGKDFFQQPVEQGGHSEALVVFDRRNKIAGYYHWLDPQQVANMQEKLDTLLTTPGGYLPDEPAELAGSSEGEVGGDGAGAEGREGSADEKDKQEENVAPEKVEAPATEG